MGRKTGPPIGKHRYKSMKDLSGRTFGRLLALWCAGRKNGKIMWSCQCECAKVALVDANELVRGNVRSCGCLRKESACKPRLDLTGKRYGNCVVLEYLGDGRWKCQCDCGAILSVQNGNLKTKNSCMKCARRKGNPGKSPPNFIDLSGSVIGRLTVIARVSSTKWRPRWLCRCECGKETTVETMSLRNGHSMSCGCYRSEFMSETKSTHGFTSKRKSRNGFISPSMGIALEYVIWQSAKSRAKRDGIPFEIALEDVVIPKHCPLLGIELVQGNKKVCDSSPSLDRKNPNLGYVKGNVQVISFRANTIKAGRTEEELRSELLTMIDAIDGVQRGGMTYAEFISEEEHTYV